MSSNPQKPTIYQSLTDSQIHHKYSKKPRISITFPTDGMTKQSFKDECDVNRIIARFQATGELPNINNLPPQYLDVTAVDFQEHQNFIAGAFSLFHELPAKIRDKFENNPGAFFDFCSQDKNRPELAEMGLLRADLPPVVPLTSVDTSEPVKTAPTPDTKTA
ncbi:MAG: internal scaffolding protein [Microviridae sp.]|nr:MAG: internal scaffolding protein [Microviridae sp.]